MYVYRSEIAELEKLADSASSAIKDEENTGICFHTVWYCVKMTRDRCGAWRSDDHYECSTPDKNCFIDSDQIENIIDLYSLAEDSVFEEEFDEIVVLHYFWDLRRQFKEILEKYDSDNKLPKDNKLPNEITA